jgi:MFS family permease
MPKEMPHEIGEWRANWGLVLTASVAIAVAGIHYHVVGTMMKPLGSAYGWTRGEVAMALTVASFLSPLTNPAIGWLADRFGPRRIALIGVPLFGISFSLLSLTGPQLWTWYAGYALFGIVHNAAGPVVWTMAVVRRFTVHRGLALAVALSGSGVLVAIIPTIVLALLGLVGIRPTFAVLGVAAVLLTLPLALIFLPRDHAAYRQAHAERVLEGTEATGLTVGEALSSTRFWRIATAFLIVSTCVGMFIVHFQSMLTDGGMTSTTAAGVAIFLGPTMIVGRLLTGFLFDHFETRLVAAVAFVLPGIACLMLLGLDGSFLFAAATAIVIGLGMGAEVDVLAYMTSKYFGLRRYGVLFGLLIGLYGLGVGLGSAAAGQVYDATGNYKMMLVIMAALAGGAGLLAATLRRPPSASQSKTTG